MSEYSRYLPPHAAITDTYSEDFGLQNAKRILDKYQSQIPCFNDDIQGTGCVALAAMLAALHVSDVKIDDVRVVIFGSGTAGTGIADQIADTIVAQTHKSKEEASKQIWYVTLALLPVILALFLLKSSPWAIPYFRGANR